MRIKLLFLFFLVGVTAITSSAFSDPLLENKKNLKELYNLPLDCKFPELTTECLRSVHIGVEDLIANKELPFDLEKVIPKIHPSSFLSYVSENWVLATVHRPAALLNQHTPSINACFTEKLITFYEEPTVVDKCGGFLFIGGHPDFSSCTMCSFDTVDFSERNDISLTYVRKSGIDSFTEFRSKESIKKGELVYLIHRPFLKWINNNHPLRNTSHLVTKAKVLNFGNDLPIVVLSGVVSNGSSGGIAVDQSGRLMGVLSGGVVSEGIAVLQPLSKEMIKKINEAKNYDGYWK